MHFSASALLTALTTTVACGSLYRLSASISPKICTGYSKLKPSDQRNWDSRLPSTVHAFAITLMTAYALGLTDVFDSDRLEKVNGSIMRARSDVTEAALSMSFGYFAADIGVIISHFPSMGGWEMLSHHIAAIASLWVALGNQQGHLYTLTMLATEVTTPFINLRWTLDVLHRRQSTTYLVNGVALFFSWLVGRILLSLVVFWHLWQHRHEVALLTPAGAMLIVAVPPLLFALNTYWFAKICRGILKLLGVISTSEESAPRKGTVDKHLAHRNGVTLNGSTSNGQLLQGKCLNGIIHASPTRQRPAAAELHIA